MCYGFWCEIFQEFATVWRQFSTHTHTQNTNRSVASRFERSQITITQVPLAIERLIRVKQVEKSKFQSQLEIRFQFVFPQRTHNKTAVEEVGKWEKKQKQQPSVFLSLCLSHSLWLVFPSLACIFDYQFDYFKLLLLLPPFLGPN